MERRSLSAEQTVAEAREVLRRLREQAQEQLARNDQLEERLREREVELTISEASENRLRAEREDLDARMRELVKAREQQKSQEVDGFKLNVARRLRIDYKDIRAIEQEKVSQENFELLCSILNSTFHTLKQVGIPMDDMLEE